MSEKDVCEVIRQIANGYKFLYDHGIVHRDLKPANILIKDDFYKIADFGFAKYYEGTKAEECIH
jgi:serine/threonine protein kinase